MLNLRNSAKFLLKLALLLGPLIGQHAAQTEPDSSSHLLQAARSELLHNETTTTCHDDTGRSHRGQSCSRRAPLTTADQVAGHRWFLEYYSEQVDGFELRVLDSSLDERLANIVHMVNSHKVINNDFFTFDSGDHQLDRRRLESVAGPEVGAPKCNEHLRQMVALMDEMGRQLAERRNNRSRSLRLDERHLRLARVLDSFGRYEPGYLSGRTHSLGQHDQCVNSHLLLGHAPGQRVASRYCWAKLDATKHLSPSLRYRHRSSFEPQNDRILVGVCLPKSCHSKTFSRLTNGQGADDNLRLAQRLIDSQFKLPASLYVDESSQVDSIYCLIDPDSDQGHLPLGGKLFFVFLVGWLALTIYATNYCAPKEAEQTQLASSLMDCLDLRQSLRDFLGHEQAVKAPSAELEKLKLGPAKWQRVDLSALDPVKVFGAAFVVLGHSLVIQSAMNQNGVKSYYLCQTDPGVLFMIVGTTIVDTFFVITGLLMGYITMKRFHAPKWPASGQTANGSRASAPIRGPAGASQLRLFLVHWFKFALSRHLLLVPLLFLVFWFKKSVLINSFIGRPMWDSGFNRHTAFGACRQESWLSPFTLMAAFRPLNKQCLPQTWSVSTDLFFSLVVPPVLLLVPRRPRLALALGLVVTLASTIWAKRAYENIDPVHKGALEDVSTEGIALLFGNIHHLYTYPHFRLSSILIGVLAGYLLYQYNSNTQPAALEWPRWFRRTATRGVLLMLVQILVLFSTVNYWKPHLHPHQSLIFSNMFNTFRIVLATCNAVLLMRMATDWRQSFVMRLFMGKFWRSLTKLNYAILLIHVDVLLHLASSASDANYFSKQRVFAEFSAAYLYCIPLALFLHVVYENPINKLVKRHLLPILDQALLR